MSANKLTIYLGSLIIILRDLSEVATEHRRSRAAEKPVFQLETTPDGRPPVENEGARHP